MIFLNIDKIVEKQKSIKPRQGTFQPRPEEYKTIKMWLDTGFKIKPRFLNHGHWLAMNQSSSGYYYFSPNEVEPMTEEEKNYYQSKYYKSSWPMKKQTVVENMVAPTTRPVAQVNTQAPSTPKTQSIPSTQTPKTPNVPINNPTKQNNSPSRTFGNQEKPNWFASTTEQKNIVSLNLETTSSNGKGNPDYGDEILHISIVSGKAHEKEIKVLLDSHVRPIVKKQWDVAESVHRFSPNQMTGVPTLDMLKPSIQKALNSGDFIITYGSEDVQFLKKNGIFVDKNKLVDIKYLFAKSNPEKSHSYTIFLEYYSRIKGAKEWKSLFQQESVNFSLVKTQTNLITSFRQREIILEGLRANIKTNPEVERNLDR